MYGSTLKEQVLKLCDAHNTHYVAFCIESSITNFRLDYAVRDVYKGTRDKVKTHRALPYLSDIFKWIKYYFPATIYRGCENDDVFSLLSEKYKDYIGQLVYCANDSDLLAIPGKHHNVRSGMIREVEYPGEILYKTGKLFATGYYNTYSKMLTGASKENFKGVKGLGKKGAYKLLKDCTTEQEMIDVVVDAYYQKYGAIARPMIEEAGILCKLLKYTSFQDPIVTNFPNLVTKKLTW